jgi:hypothetical protein
MGEERKRDELLAEIQDAKVEWKKTAILVPVEDQEKPLLDGWSVKDVYAHLMWHENEMLGVIRNRRLTGSDLWQRPLDERNRSIWEQHRDLPATEVRERSRNIHEALFKELGALTDRDLTTPGVWSGFPADWTLWDLLRGNTFEHYRGHTADLKRYLARTGGEAEIVPE